MDRRRPRRHARMLVNGIAGASPPLRAGRRAIFSMETNSSFRGMRSMNPGANVVPFAPRFRLSRPARPE